MIRLMHPVANQVPVPVEAIAKELIAYAIPGFTGSRTVHLRVREDAGLCVDFIPAGIEAQGTGRPPAAAPSWRAVSGHREPTERELKVKQKLAENMHKFQIGMKLTAVVAHFIDGNLNRFDLVTVG
jgi:hypothetical protein